MNDELTPIAEYCEHAGLPWDGDRAGQMAHYLELLLHFDETLGLVGPDDEATIVDELLVDSLVAAAARRPDGEILDVGTGAGLPGIPLKIVYPNCPLTLVEPKGRRTTFLKIAIHRMGLEDVELFDDRVEAFERTGFDYVISKAFRDPVEWLELAAGHAAPTGAVVCMARQRDRDDLNELAEELGFGLVGDAAIGPAGDEQRVCYAFERV